MTTKAYGSAIYTDTLSIYQWNQWLSDSDKKHIGRYFIVSKNLELLEMMGVPIGSVHFKCLVDDYGNLVRMQ